MQKQVNKEHYDFRRYVHKRRWASMWHQVDEVLAMKPDSVLEIGPGPGVFQAIVSRLGPRVETLDIDPDLNPDHVAPADAMPFADNAFDVVCAFQMLEHVPYEISLAIFREMARVARKGVIISLPDALTKWPVAIYIPWIGMKWLHILKPQLQQIKKNRFDGEHYWEINKAGYLLAKIVSDFGSNVSVDLVRTYPVDEHPRHRFLVYKKSIRN